MPHAWLTIKCGLDDEQIITKCGLKRATSQSGNEKKLKKGDQISPNFVVVQRVDRGSCPHEVPDSTLADQRPNSIACIHNGMGVPWLQSKVTLRKVSRT